MSRQSEFQHALLANTALVPSGLHTCNGSDPATRFAVYRNNVLSSLINALADSYPVVQALVGVEFFRAMAQHFVQQQPPRSRLLVHYGDDLATFLERFEPVNQLPYLPDVARLEASRIHAYHAADAAPLAHSELAAAIGDHQTLASLVLHLHPCVRLLSSAYAVRSLWAAHQGELAIEQVAIEQPEHCLILRQHLDVLVVAITADAAVFIAHLLAGQPLGAAAANCPTAFDLSACLALLLHHGAITALSYRELP